MAFCFFKFSCSGETDAGRSKFVCPTQLDIFALPSFDCYIFLVDAYSNPLTPSFNEISQLHVKFDGATTREYLSSYKIQNNVNAVEELSFDASMGADGSGVRAQYIATLGVVPASTNESFVGLSGHFHAVDVTTNINIDLVQTSPEELALYSSSLLCGKKNIVAGSSVSCTLRIRKSGVTIEVPSLLGLLDVQVANKQTTSNPVRVTKRAVGDRFLLSFTPTASGDASVSVYLNIGSGSPPRLITATPEIVPVQPNTINANLCQVSAPTTMVAGQTRNVTLSIRAFDSYSNRITSPNLATTFHGRVIRLNHDDGGANDHPILHAKYEATTQSYVLHFPPIVTAGIVVASLGQGAQREALAVPFYHSHVRVVPTDIDPSTSTLECPDEAVVGGQVECIVRLRDAYSNVAPPTDGTFQSLAAESLLFEESTSSSTLPSSKERATPSLKSLVDSSGMASGVSVTFGFRQSGQANVSIGLVGANEKIGNAVLPIFRVPIAVDLSRISCPFSTTAAGGATSCTIYVVDDANNPTGDRGSTALFDVRVSSGGVALPTSDISVQYISTGTYIISFTPIRAGKLAIEAAAGDQGRIESVEPSSIEVVAGPISSSTSILTCDFGTGENGAAGGAAGGPGGIVDSTDVTGGETTELAIGAAMNVVRSGGIASCSLRLNDL